MVNRYNRITALMQVDGEIRVLKRSVFSRKKKFGLWPVDTHLPINVTIRCSALMMLRTVFKRAVKWGSIHFVCTEKLTAIGSCRYEYFVLFVAPESLRMNELQKELLFEKKDLTSVRLTRSKLLKRIIGKVRETDPQANSAVAQAA